MITTAEQVSKYHPDKVADQVSDKILVYLLEKNKNAKVAIETLIKDNVYILAGEISGAEITNQELANLVTFVVHPLGYDVDEIINLIGSQSLEIQSAVEQKELGAGDQGIMVGYATSETESYLPQPIDFANRIIKLLQDQVEITLEEQMAPDGRKMYKEIPVVSSGQTEFCQIRNVKVIKYANGLKGDMKTQATFNDWGELEKLVISVCHTEDLKLEDVRVKVKDIIKSELVNDLSEDFELIINPAGEWNRGGPISDSGLTGRKIVADQYGPSIQVGGGSFSGKDLTKVDRSASYMARKVAVELLDKYGDGRYGDIGEVRIQVAYAIGLSEPVDIKVYFYEGEGYEVDIDYDKVIKSIKHRFKVSSMIKELSTVNLYEMSQGCHYRNKF